MPRSSITLLVALAATAASAAPARAALVAAFDEGTYRVSRSTSAEPLTASYAAGSLLVSGGDLRLGAGTYSAAALKFAVGPDPVASAWLTIDVVLTQGTVGYSGNIPLLISGFATDATPLGAADFLVPATAGPTLSLLSALGNDGVLQHLYSVDVTALVRSIIAGGATAIELRLSDAASNSNVMIAPSGLNAPMLMIAPLASVPEPASAPLAALGLALTAARAARRRAVPTPPAG